MLQRTEGIVLKTIPFGEADLIVTYLTETHGIIKTFAKSPRKTKSRFGSSLEPLTHSKIAFWGKEDAALPRLTQSDIIHPFSSLRNSLKCFLPAAEMVELTLNFMAERDANGEVYVLLINTLRALEADCGARLLPLYYKVRLLSIVGYLPGLDGCGRCGKAGSEFYLSHGTVLCRECSGENESSLKISPGMIRLHGTLLEWSLSKLERIKPQEALVAELSRLLDDHVKYITEKTSRAGAYHKYRQ
ncbi:MAG: DNA repair protein RecO [Candidatus Sulfobium sp.]|jgi:DNA repair protein RecO (recombination protein O)